MIGQRARRKRPEDVLQKAVCEFLDVALPRGVAIYFAVPNGGLRTKAEAGILKAMGVKAGVADLCVIWNPGKAFARVGFIELKAPKGKASDAQVAFSASCKAVGAKIAQARSLDDVEQALRLWGCPLRVAQTTVGAQ